jgi:hypothetical protein
MVMRKQAGVLQTSVTNGGLPDKAIAPVKSRMHFARYRGRMLAFRAQILPVEEAVKKWLAKRKRSEN